MGDRWWQMAGAAMVLVLTDSIPEEPREGHPVLVPASMRGDREFVIFTRPEKISTTVRRVC